MKDICGMEFNWNEMEEPNQGSINYRIALSCCSVMGARVTFVLQYLIIVAHVIVT